MPWQKFDQDGSNSPTSKHAVVVERLKLPHGWLVRTYFQQFVKEPSSGAAADLEFAANVSIAFVPVGPAPWN